MCFAPQLRALFRHLNFQTCSVTEVFCTFWLPHVLRATTACTFSTSQLPKVVRRWCVLYILTWKCASRHNSVQLSCLIWPHGSAPAALASLLFDPPGPLYATTRRHYTTLHYNYNYNYNYTTTATTPHHTTLHPAVVGEATTATIPKGTTPPSVDFLWSPIFETSATALCGSTGIHSLSSK